MCHLLSVCVFLTFGLEVSNCLLFADWLGYCDPMNLCLSFVGKVVNWNGSLECLSVQAEAFGVSLRFELGMVGLVPSC